VVLSYKDWQLGDLMQIACAESFVSLASAATAVTVGTTRLTGEEREERGRI
jgi:hypothetical protein